MDKSTIILLEKVKGNASAAKYLSQSKAHAKEAESSTNYHAIFKGAPGDIEKQMSKKHGALKGLHKQVSDLLLQIHTIHKGPEQ